jgi:hypothetical protein
MNALGSELNLPKRSPLINNPSALCQTPMKSVSGVVIPLLAARPEPVAQYPGLVSAVEISMYSTVHSP